MGRASLLLVVLCACGGGGGSATSGRSPADGHKTPPNDSIADIAGREGISSLADQKTAASGGAAGSLRLESVDKDNPIRLDGVPKEWTLVAARTGSIDGVTFKCGLAADGQHVFFAGDVSGVTLRHLRRFVDGEDHMTLAMAAPGSAPVELTFFAGKPGETAGVVRAHGRDVPGAKIVEAESGSGYTFEAEVPWSALVPPTVRVGLRGVARFHDGKGGALATSADLAPLPSDAEEAVVEQLLAPKGLLAASPKFDLLADLRGDAMKERITVYDHYLTVVGPNYRGGKEFFYRELGGDVVSLEARDLTGRGKQDLVVRRKLGGSDEREWLDVWTWLDDEPTTVFSHEVSVAYGGNKVTNAVRLRPREIEVTYEPAVGFDATSYSRPRASDTEPVLLPWGTVKSQTFRFDGSKFVKAREITQQGVAPAAPPVTTTTTVAATRTTTAPTTVEMHAPTTDQLLARYRSDRGIPAGTRARVDVALGQARVALIGRDLVVYGSGFKGGLSYGYVTLSQFADAGDVEEVSVHGPYVVVRGVRHVNAQAAGTFDLQLMFLYALRGDGLARVLGIETARSQGGKRIQADVQLTPAGSGFDVVARPGHATGWTDKTYPFTQDQPGSGTVEPLLLPWGGIDHLRYTDNGTFTKAP